MRLIQCIQTKNPSYQRNRKIKPVGILVHSTGASNAYLKRYVDCPDQLGNNLYNNHWNKSSANKSMHAFIGLDKNDDVTVVQTLPYDIACWGAGGGSKGSANYDPQAHIQFEVCEDYAPRSGKAPTQSQMHYYDEVWALAEDYCVYLCKMFGWTEKNITSHYEMAAKGYASRHSDPAPWMKIFDDSMDKFRSRVGAKLRNEIVKPSPKPEPLPAPEPIKPTPQPEPGVKEYRQSPYIVFVRLDREENAKFYNKPLGSIIELNLEDYVRGVVASEVGNAHLSVCKAQAVAARTAIVRQLNKVVTDTSSFQAFRASRMNNKSYLNAIEAVNSTYGQVLTYNGQVIDCYFSHSNGGTKRVPEDTWRLNVPKEQRGNSRPYYISALDPWTTEDKKGHGIGLSQSGASNAAKQGINYVHILQFYYTGCNILNYYTGKYLTYGGKAPDPVGNDDDKEGHSSMNSNDPVLYQAIVQTSKPLSLNLWKKPSKVYESYQRIPKGATVDVLEDLNSKWVRVRYDSKVGYVDPQYLVRITGSGDPRPPNQGSSDNKDNKLRNAINQAISILQDAIR